MMVAGPATALLAQSAGSRGAVLLWVGVLIGLVVLASVVLLLIRRHFLSDNRGGTSDRGFLDELRAMRDRGEISAEEFERTRRSIAERLRGSTPRPLAPPEASRDSLQEPP